MNTAILIPARYQSSRYPGKPLVGVRGTSGISKPLIQRSWEAAVAGSAGAQVIIATDDHRIEAAASAFGARVVMTPVECANGTERCSAALSELGPEIEFIVNLQGDALLTPPWFLPPLVDALRSDPSAAVATPAIRASAEVHKRLLADQSAGRVGGTTVALSREGKALYFSKRVIPYVPEARLGDPGLPVFLHVGVYAYRRAALDRYGQLPASVLEELEGLEQLRFLDAGIAVTVVEVDPQGNDIWELNNPTDLAPIEAALAARGLE
jgi:3-deoxy-manno-octulosonate cytidylyltransferase (CMP-KDO synthetase)